MRLRDQAPCLLNPGMWAQPAKDGMGELGPEGLCNAYPADGM